MIVVGRISEAGKQAFLRSERLDTDVPERRYTVLCKLPSVRSIGMRQTGAQ